MLICSSVLDGVPISYVINFHQGFGNVSVLNCLYTITVYYFAQQTHTIYTVYYITVYY
jgi:hypothetical protein